MTTYYFQLDVFIKLVFWCDFFHPGSKPEKMTCKQVPKEVNLLLQSRCYSKQVESTIKRRCGYLSLPSAPPLLLKLASDIIASCVQQLPRKGLCYALFSLQQNCREAQNQGVTGFHKGLCVFWLTTEGQITSLNCTKWSNKGWYTSLYSISCLDTKGSGIWAGCPASKSYYFC